MMRQGKKVERQKRKLVFQSKYIGEIEKKHNIHSYNNFQL